MRGLCSTVPHISKKYARPLHRTHIGTLNVDLMQAGMVWHIDQSCGEVKVTPIFACICMQAHIHLYVHTHMHTQFGHPFPCLLPCCSLGLIFILLPSGPSTMLLFSCRLQQAVGSSEAINGTPDMLKVLHNSTSFSPMNYTSPVLLAALLLFPHSHLGVSFYACFLCLNQFFCCMPNNDPLFTKIHPLTPIYACCLLRKLSTKIHIVKRNQHFLEIKLLSCYLGCTCGSLLYPGHKSPEPSGNNSPNCSMKYTLGCQSRSENNMGEGTCQTALQRNV